MPRSRAVAAARASLASVASATLLLVLPQLASAGNPVVPGVGMADPHVHFFNGLFYMYSTHDYAPNNTGFRMDNWWTWSSPDLVSWTQGPLLLPQQTPATPGEYQECWATDGAAVNGTWYFYLSMGPNEIGVVSSTVSPAGPWSNTLGKALVNASVGPTLNPPTTSRDPCVFGDEDGSYFLVFGVFEYYVARLGADMMSLAEPPRHITVVNPTGPYGNKTDDKAFMHKANGIYYLSWGCFYATGTSPYGPFTYQGSVVNTSYISPDFRMNQTTGPWYGWEDLADRHGSFWTAHGQWYYSANDRSHSTDTAHPEYYRDTVLAYVDYYSDGTIKPVTIDGTGVGQYRAGGWEAEHFFALRSKRATFTFTSTSTSHAAGDRAMASSTGSSRASSAPVPGSARKAHDADGTFGVHGISTDSLLYYPHVRDLPAALPGPAAAGVSSESSSGLRLWLRASNGGSTPVRIVARQRSPLDDGTTATTAAAGAPDSAPVLCSAVLPPTGGWDVYTTVSCTVDTAGAGWAAAVARSSLDRSAGYREGSVRERDGDTQEEGKALAVAAPQVGGEAEVDLLLTFELPVEAGSSSSFSSSAPSSASTASTSTSHHASVPAVGGLRGTSAGHQQHQQQEQGQSEDEDQKELARLDALGFTWPGAPAA